MQDWDFRKLQALRELEVQGTVTGAARALSMTPSSVSQQLSQLAAQVGAPVIEPRGRRVVLTETARVLLRHTEVVFNQLRRAEEELHARAQGEVGEVHVASMATAIEALVVPSVRLLRASHPGIVLCAHEMEATEAFEQLAAGEVDVALSLAVQAPSATDVRFVRYPLMADPLDVALPAGHRLAERDELQLADLADESWIVGPNGPWREITFASCGQAGFVPQARHTAVNWAAITAMVEAGMGIALLPRLIAPSTRGVVVRELPADRPQRHIVAAVRRGAELSPRLPAVLRVLQQAAEEKNRLRHHSP